MRLLTTCILCTSFLLTACNSTQDPYIDGDMPYDREQLCAHLIEKLSPYAHTNPKKILGNPRLKHMMDLYKANGCDK